MRLEITRVEGLRNDLLLRIDRSEIETATLSVANRAQLMALPGMPRHREAGPEEAQGVADAKVPIEEHLRRLGVVDETGKGRQRAIAISNRNLGTNHGHVVRADIEWATYGQKVLRHGSVARVDDLIDEFYEAPPRSHSC